MDNNSYANRISVGIFPYDYHLELGVVNNADNSENTIKKHR
ncbi:hypothetical protein ACLBWZ_13330 [Brucellaceae bacterium C25G]